jgi:xanthine dehydrogenase accessory factor
MGGAPRRQPVVVLGIADVASAVAHRLFTSGWPVCVHSEPAPAVVRRRMSFADAAYDRRVELAGVRCYRMDSIDDVPPLLAARTGIPLFLGELDALRSRIRPGILVDARMRKRAAKERLRGLAPLTIGLGPGFEAGANCDIAVETAWGPDLGRLIRSGRTKDAEGEPREIGGHAADRVARAPRGGEFRTDRGIGEAVSGGAVVARVGSEPIKAPLEGVLRGIVRDGARVEGGAKVVEIDPRGAAAVFEGLGERPARIAESVLEAAEAWRSRSK